MSQLADSLLFLAEALGDGRSLDMRLVAHSLLFLADARGDGRSLDMRLVSVAMFCVADVMGVGLLCRSLGLIWLVGLLLSLAESFGWGLFDSWSVIAARPMFFYRVSENTLLGLLLLVAAGWLRCLRLFYGLLC